MILKKILKIGRKKSKDQKDAAEDGMQKEGGVQKTVTQHIETNTQEDNNTQVSKETQKKTKINKINKALNEKGRKKRSKRVAHTKKSFHPKKRRSVKEQVFIHDIIGQPVVTEKAANESEKGIYTFIVHEKANKYRIAEAIEALYDVKPKKVRIAKKPAKKKRLRIPGKEREFGMTAVKKKAYVFLREGDKIQLT